MKKLPAYNNNIHKFEMVNAHYVDISTDNGVELRLYSNKDKEFRLHTATVSKYLFDFKDSYTYESDVIDDNQSKVVKFDIQGYDENGNKLDRVVLLVTFFNGVVQRWEYPEVCDGVVNLSDDKMPYFEGYPFEYSKVEGEKVKRVLVDNGSGLGTDDNVRIIRTNCCDGYYLKWHNGKWGYSYYLFDRIGKEKLGTKSVGALKELLSWADNYLEIGKDGQREITLFKQVEYEDRELMKSLVTSPEVYLYTGQRGEKASVDDWLEVRIKGGVEETNKDNTFRQIVTVILPQEQTIKRL